MYNAIAQERRSNTSTMEQQLETLVQSNEAAINDDSYVQQQDRFRKHPLNLNTASKEELDELNILSALQVAQFLLYKKLLGKLINLYELQAIPSWDIATIKILLPFITVADNKSIAESLKERWTGGDMNILGRYASAIEKSKGYRPLADSANHYLGSPDKMYFRYTYNYKNLLQWGLLGDKDAGEQFLRGYQKQGFDFYSFHFFARKLGIIKALAIGDFTVNFGQGLTQWQSLAFKKSAAVLNVKRQSATLRPYNSAGEYNFHRGVGITLQQKRWEATIFASYKKISANLVSDTISGDDVFSSFQQGGYHRTVSENADRNSLQQAAAGANLRYANDRLEIGASAIYFHFSKPLQKSANPYYLFALQGYSLFNTSINYGYTYRNIHLFGEAAIDHQYHTGFVQGALISLDAKLDASFVYRSISRSYHSVNTNAFTESGSPVNESGLYAGIEARPLPGIKIDAYADVFRFPWLKYRVDQPSSGRDFFIQLTYTPNKTAELYIRYKTETKMINRSGNTSITSITDAVTLQNLRLQSGITVNKEWSLKNRVEWVGYRSPAPAQSGQGFLSYIETNYKPNKSTLQGNLRLQYFETGGYNERIYTYESDLPYNFSIPFYYGKGFRYYCNINWDASRLLNKKGKHAVGLDCWLRWAQTIYPGLHSIGSGLDQINGNHHSEIKFELVFTK